jgi:hypothetical protein
VRGAKCGRWNTLPFRIIPEGGQVSENLTEGGSPISAKEAWNVLHEDVAGSKIAYEARELRPEPAGIGLGSTLSSGRDWLAGESTAEEIDWFEAGGASLPCGLPFRDLL